MSEPVLSGVELREEWLNSLPKKRERNHKRDGWSIAAAAKELGFSPSTVKKAIELGQLKTMKPLGMKFETIPDAEVQRIKELFR